MTWRDKLELGLKEDAAYRKDNLPASQIRGPEVPTGPGRSPEIPLAHGGTGPQVSDRAHCSPGTEQARRTARLRTGPAQRKA
jgi:hypothetical protein